MNAYANKNTGKLLVAVLAMAMVIAGTAIVFSGTETSAEIPEGAPTLNGEISTQSLTDDTYLSGDATISVGNTLTLGTNTLYLNGFTLTVNGGTITATKAISVTEGGSIDETGSINRFIVNSGTVENVTFTNFNMAIVNTPSSSGTVTIEGCTFVPVSGSVSAVYINMGPSVTGVTIKDCVLGTSYSEKALNLMSYEDGNVKIKVENCGDVSVNLYGPQTGDSVDTPLSIGDSTGSGNILDLDEKSSITELNLSTVPGDSNAKAPTVKIEEQTYIPEVTGDGDLIINAPFETEGMDEGIGTTIGENGSYKISGTLALGDTINADLTIPDYAYLTSTLTIPEGKTLTISGNATLNMINFDIIVNGTLVIERNGVITSTDTDNSITLSRTGSIQNSGIIGDINTVTIKGQTPAETPTYVGEVKMQGVSGVNVNLVRSGNNYYLAVSGDISKISSVSTANLGLSDVTINADTQFGRNVNVTITDAVEIAANVSVTNAGVMTISDIDGLVLNNGSSLVVNGSTSGKVCVKTGTVGEGSTVSGLTDITLGNNVRGITVSADRVTIPSVTPGGQAIIEQRAYITGTLNYVTNDNTGGRTVQLGQNNVVYVIDTLYIPEEITVSGGTFDVSATGTIQVEQPSATGTAISFVGAKYTIESTSEGVTSEMDYYTSFANAMAAINDAKDMTITISGKFTVDQSYQLGADQYISGDADVTIGENAVITLNDGATIDNTAFSLIEGQVIVNDGGTYRPASNEGIYAVTSTNKETNTTIYSGFKVALDGASAGDVISVVGNATYDGNMTIVSGVIVNLNDDVDLNVTGSLTVETDGELNLGNVSVLTVGTAGKTNSINVAGSIDSSEGTIAGLGTVNLYSTGEVVYPATGTMTGVKINAAYYDDGDRVYTSVANAAAYAEENILPGIYATGTFSESGEVTLTVPLYIQNGADVTLGTVTLDGTFIESVTAGVGATPGVYSATINGMSGTGDAAVVATVVVDDTAAKIESGSTLNAAGESQYTMTVSAVDGDVEIAAGTVGLGAAGFTIDADNTLAVASGATLVLGTAETISIATGAPTGVDYNDSLTNEGTILIQDAISVGSNITLPGDVTVNEGGQLIVGIDDDDAAYVLTVTGTLTISDVENEEGSMSVTGAVNVGAAPEMLGQSATGAIVGKVTLTGNAYVKVFDGASVADATFTDNSNNAVKSTAFVINGTAFATVYTFGTQNAGVVNSDVGNLVNLDEDQRDSAKIEWYAGETKVGNTPAIGTYAELSTEIKYAGVQFTVSEGPGISIYIDNVDVDALRTDDGSVYITIGQHTITVYVNAGYEGTPSITLNGTAISGTFEVTSDMIGGDNVIFATGASPIDYNQGGSTGGSDDGMGLTDYLLIILVVLIVIMAIMVAMRLMRS